MKRFRCGFRSIPAVFFVAVLFCAAFCGTVPNSALAEGGSDLPVTGDTAVAATLVPGDQGAEPGEVSIFATALIVFGNVL
jgi:hypothetical protein